MKDRKATKIENYPRSQAESEDESLADEQKWRKLEESNPVLLHTSGFQDQLPAYPAAPSVYTI